MGEFSFFISTPASLFLGFGWVLDLAKCATNGMTAQ